MDGTIIELIPLPLVLGVGRIMSPSQIIMIAVDGVELVLRWSIPIDFELELRPDVDILFHA